MVRLHASDRSGHQIRHGKATVCNLCIARTL